jgi:pimeloyl-ACP methyl ester carboxylesterase
VKVLTHGPTLTIVFVAATLAGCAQTPAATIVVDTPAPSAPPSIPSPTPLALPATSAPPDPLASPSLDGAFAVDDSGRKLAMQCWGTGSPAVFLETGGGAIDEFTRSPLVRRLAAETQVCLYNRAGTPPSDPAPNRPREAEDVAADFQALVKAAGIEPPFVLFGRSFGGMLVTFYASEHPSEVAGVVVFDSPAPSATMTLADFPEGVWDYPGNESRLNVLTGFENRFGKTPVQLDMPLILISPTAGETTAEDRYWLQTSPRSKQIVIEGGMEVIDTEADQVAAAILSLVDGTATF